MEPEETYSDDDVALAREDAKGISGQKHLTNQQIYWISLRLGYANDLEACIQANIDLETVELWRADPDFEEVLQNCLRDKRGAFKYLGIQVLPKIMQGLLTDLDSGSARRRLKATEYILRSQGLLVDKTEKIDKAALDDLLRSLNAPMPAQVIDVSQHRYLPAGED